MTYGWDDEDYSEDDDDIGLDYVDDSDLEGIDLDNVVPAEGEDYDPDLIDGYAELLAETDLHDSLRDGGYFDEEDQGEEEGDPTLDAWFNRPVYDPYEEAARLNLDEPEPEPSLPFEAGSYFDPLADHDLGALSEALVPPEQAVEPFSEMTSLPERPPALEKPQPDLALQLASGDDLLQAVINVGETPLDQLPTADAVPPDPSFGPSADLYDQMFGKGWRDQYGDQLVPNQYEAGRTGEMTAAEAAAACGPAAAVAFVRATGKNPTMAQALQVAKEVGWDAGHGMYGTQAQQRLFERMGVETDMEMAIDGHGRPVPGADESIKQRMIQEIQAGRPATVSTNLHYFVATDYDPATGEFDFQASGSAPFGTRKLTFRDMITKGKGLQGALFMRAGQEIDAGQPSEVQAQAPEPTKPQTEYGPRLDETTDPSTIATAAPAAAPPVGLQPQPSFAISPSIPPAYAAPTRATTTTAARSQPQPIVLPSGEVILAQQPTTTRAPTGTTPRAPTGTTTSTVRPPVGVKIDPHIVPPGVQKDRRFPDWMGAGTGTINVNTDTPEGVAWLANFLGWMHYGNQDLSAPPAWKLAPGLQPTAGGPDALNNRQRQMYDLAEYVSGQTTKGEKLTDQQAREHLGISPEDWRRGKQGGKIIDMGGGQFRIFNADANSWETKSVGSPTGEPLANKFTGTLRELADSATSAREAGVPFDKPIPNGGIVAPYGSDKMALRAAFRDPARADALDMLLIDRVEVGNPQAAASWKEAEQRLNEQGKSAQYAIQPDGQVVRLMPDEAVPQLVRNEYRANRDALGVVLVTGPQLGNSYTPQQLNSLAWLRNDVVTRNRRLGAEGEVGLMTAPEAQLLATNPSATPEQRGREAHQIGWDYSNLNIQPSEKPYWSDRGSSGTPQQANAAPSFRPFNVRRSEDGTITVQAQSVATKPIQASPPVASDPSRAWFEDVFTRYPFTPEAVNRFRTLNFEVAPTGPNGPGGGFWETDRNTVKVFGRQDEATIHELSHAYWENLRNQGTNAQDLMQAVVRLSEDRDPQYARAEALAVKYVHGDPSQPDPNSPTGTWRGMLVDRNDHEMFAGLASGVMGDMSQLPPYIRPFYSGLFKGSTDQGATVAATKPPAPARSEPLAQRGNVTGEDAAAFAQQIAATDPLPSHLDTSSRQANLRQWAPLLGEAERQTGLRADALAAIIVAENGAGQSQLSSEDNNYFSITYVGHPTQIGPGSGGRFGKYANPADSLAHFIDLVSTSPRYRDAWENRQDPEKFFQGLIDGHYIVPEPGYPVEIWLRNLRNFQSQYHEAIGS